MALQPFVNRAGNPYAGLPVVPSVFGLPTNATLDAAGESCFGIGVLVWATGPGTSKVVSSAGGRVAWVATSVTFANAGTNLRIGIQDLSGGLEDGTFDVQADLVGGTDTITAGVVSTAMESGSKTIAHGTAVAIGLEMTTRGGADSIGVTRPNVVLGYPYASIDSGAGPTKTAACPMVTVMADDGTVGWILGTVPPNVITTTTFGSGSTPDEYALIFQLPFPATCYGIAAVIDNMAAGDTCEVVLYSDPLGTPVAERTIAINPDLVRLATDDAVHFGLFASGYDLLRNTNYAVTLRPTSVNTLSILRMAFGTGNADLRMPTQFGTSCSEGTRSDQTGTFTSDTERLPLIGPILSAFSDGVGGGAAQLINSRALVD